MADVRIPRGYARTQTQYMELSEGKRPSLSEDGTNLLPAPWLPAAFIENVHDDPVIIPAGFFVGRINTTDHNAAYTAVAAAWRRNYLVPASMNTGTYTLTNSQYDIDYEVPDADNWSTAVAATGATTLAIEQVKPIGITFQDLYPSYFSLRYKNYERQSMSGILCWGYNVMLPMRTTEECAIQPGDLVVIQDNDHAKATWLPTDLSTNTVATLKPYESGDSPEFIVGRCLEVITLATQTAGSAGQTLAAGLTASNVSSPINLDDLGKVQTPPGLGLQGSGTQGLPGWTLGACARSSAWKAIVLSVDCR